MSAADLLLYSLFCSGPLRSGFRLVASSILPISHQTLVYGSSDMGKTVKNENKVLSKLMEKAGRKMNIKGTPLLYSALIKPTAFF